MLFFYPYPPHPVRGGGFCHLTKRQSRLTYFQRTLPKFFTFQWFSHNRQLNINWLCILLKLTLCEKLLIFTLCARSNHWSYCGPRRIWQNVCRVSSSKSKFETSYQWWRSKRFSGSCCWRKCQRLYFPHVGISVLATLRESFINLYILFLLEDIPSEISSDTEKSFNII